MAHDFQLSSAPRHAVVIIGGAVAGSEAAALCSERGILAVVLEQNERPFGKIEDGLPRWHEKLRIKEYAQIGKNLSAPGVLFVPRTQLGRDVTLEEILRDWGVNAVLLASGAWRDRPLFSGPDAFDGPGLVYQNPFVYWYNHYPEEGYRGPRFEVGNGAVVVGGGLASIDVAKIINCELYKRALAARGIQVTTLELEHAGIPETLAKHQLSPDALGVVGATLYYRREKTAMPLASAPDNATPEQLAKVAQVRAKVMDKVTEKYLVGFAGNHAPLAPLVEDGRMVGVRFQRTRSVAGRLEPIPGDAVDVRSPLVVSSIGSVPTPIPGLPMKGELVDFADWQTGRVRGFDHMFGLGNVLTGKGNIKESRKSSTEISQQIVRWLGLDGEPSLDAAHASAREAAEPALRDAVSQPPLSTDRVADLVNRVQMHWNRVGYPGDYASWMARVTPRGAER
jgi:NADPH-dependent glutamate synthase beta subunit-like oxidoreductase